MLLRELRGVVEGSYTIEEVPSVFFVALPFDPSDEARMGQFAAGEFLGLRGISASKEIVLEFLGVAREALLVMPGEALLKANKATRVQYDNPRYLTSKGMWALYRLLQKDPDSSSDRYQLMGRLKEYLRAELAKGADTKGLAQVVDAARLEGRFADGAPINTPEELAAWFEAALLATARYDSDKKVVEKGAPHLLKAVLAALGKIGATYKGEGEWVLKGESLKVPAGSTLVLLRPEVDEVEYEKWREAKGLGATKWMWQADGFKRWEGIQGAIERYGLRSKYKVKLVSEAQFERTKARLWAQRSSG